MRVALVSLAFYFILFFWILRKGREHPEVEGECRALPLHAAPAALHFAAMSVSIDIPSWLTLQPPDGSPRFTAFVIRIRLGAFAWAVYRRYSSFAALGEALRRAVAADEAAGGSVTSNNGEPLAPLAACPPKHTTAFGALGAALGAAAAPSHAFLETRREALREWLRALARDERVCRSADFHEFLRAQANVRAKMR